MDELKKYLQNVRDQFDLQKPPAKVWDSIHDANKQSKHRARKKLQWIAAAVFAVIFTAAYLFIQRDKAGNIEPLSKKKERIPVTETDSSAHTVSKSVNNTRAATLLTKPVRPQKTPGSIKKKLPRSNHPALHNDNSQQPDYALLIRKRIQQLSQTPVYATDTSYFGLFLEQFAGLNETEKELNEIFSASLQKEFLQGRLIMVYKKKENLLKELIEEINRINKCADELGIGSNIPGFIKLK